MSHLCSVCGFECRQAVPRPTTTPTQRVIDALRAVAGVDGWATARDMQRKCKLRAADMSCVLAVLEANNIIVTTTRQAGRSTPDGHGGMTVLLARLK